VRNLWAMAMGLPATTAVSLSRSRAPFWYQHASGWWCLRCHGWPDVGTTRPMGSSGPGSDAAGASSAPTVVRSAQEEEEEDVEARPVLQVGLDGGDLLDPEFLTRGLGSRLASDVLEALAAARTLSPSSPVDLHSAAGFQRPLIQLHLTTSVGGAGSRSPSRFSDEEGPGRGLRGGRDNGWVGSPPSATAAAKVVFKPSAQEVVDTVLGVFDRIPSACQGHNSVTGPGAYSYRRGLVAAVLSASGTDIVPCSLLERSVLSVWLW
jgi:hypothetical protein